MKLIKLCKYTVVFSMVSSMAFGFVGCGGSVASSIDASDSEATALNKDVFIVGLDDNFPPMGYRDENGDIVGFDVDFAKAFGEKLGKEIEFQTIDWTMKEAELDAGNIDFIWNGYSINDERKAQVDFSVPYLKNKQIIITLVDSAINTKADLANKVVGAQAGSTAVEAVENQPEVMETFKDGKVVTYENNNDALMDLEAGRLEAVVADEVLVNYYMTKKGQDKFKVLTENFGEEEYGVGMKKGDTKLVEALNDTYKALKEDGTMAEISEKWFGEDITQ